MQVVFLRNKTRSEGNLQKKEMSHKAMPLYPFNLADKDTELVIVYLVEDIGD